jgi:hypothetical protein
MIDRSKEKPKAGDLVAGAGEDKRDDPNYGGDEEGDPLTKTGLPEDEEDEGGDTQPAAPSRKDNAT